MKISPSIKQTGSVKHQYYLLLILVFFLLGLLGILNHAMWRDELNGWLIARDSYSLADFLHNIKYEGHPVIWYFCLAFLNQLTSNPVAMQIFHLLIATGYISLFVIFSPLTKLQKTLFVFGYLPFYEYLLVSRNYAIGILCLMLFCVFFNTRQKSYLFLSIILAFMANTNAYCLMISIALTLTLIFEYLLRQKINQRLTASIPDIIISLIIFAIAVLISVVTLLPPGDSNLQGGASQWLLQFDFSQLTKTITRIWNSYILIIVPSDDKPIDAFIFSALSLGLFAFASTILIRTPIALFFYWVGSLGILLFTYVKFLGSPRHYGHLYIIFIVSLWLVSYYPQSDLLVNLSTKMPRKIQRICKNWIALVDKHKKTFILIILLAQFIAGIVSFSRDVLVPYSASHDTARFIESQQLEASFIVGSEDFAVAPISGYLNRKIYYPETQQMGSFVLFNNQRKVSDQKETLEQVSQLVKQHQEILLILNSQLNSSRDDLKIMPLQQFTNSFLHNEKYYLYKVNLLQKSSAAGDKLALSKLKSLSRSGRGI